jgi:hypothetical protein
MTESTESLTRLLVRTNHVCKSTAKHCHHRAATTVDTLVRVALIGFAKQLEDRAAQIDAWLSEPLNDASPERKDAMRASCEEWLRMQE